MSVFYTHDLDYLASVARAKELNAKKQTPTQRVMEIERVVPNCLKELTKLKRALAKIKPGCRKNKQAMELKQQIVEIEVRIRAYDKEITWLKVRSAFEPISDRKHKPKK